MSKLVNLIGLMFISLYLPKCFSAYPQELSNKIPDSMRWTFSHANACLKADDTHRINANGECLAIQTYINNTLPQKNSRLLIFIHGDGIPGGSPADYLKFQATKFVDSRTIAIVVIRPGYYDSYDNYSTGESYAFSCNGYPCDGYRENTVATLAAMIQELKKYYQPSCTILVGHSGGGIMSSIILGKYPRLADGAVLASITNNVHQWASRHGWGNWPNSLSPHEWINRVPKHSFVYIVSGTSDENTYPELTHNYYTALKNAGVDVHFLPVNNGTHNSIVTENVIDFDNAIKDALNQCPASK